MKGFKVFLLMLLVMMFTLNSAQAAPDVGYNIKLVPLPVFHTIETELHSGHILSCFNDHLAPDPILYINSYNNAAIDLSARILVIQLKTVHFIHNTKLNGFTPTINKSDRVKYRCKQ